MKTLSRFSVTGYMTQGLVNTNLASSLLLDLWPKNLEDSVLEANIGLSGIHIGVEAILVSHSDTAIHPLSMKCPK
jgi:hypothetical protein